MAVRLELHFAGGKRQNSGNNSSSFEAALTQFCPGDLRAILHTVGKSGKWILSALLCAKMKEGKRQNI